MPLDLDLLEAYALRSKPKKKSCDDAEILEEYLCSFTAC